MNIVIVGCGRVGARLSKALDAQGHQVAVVDENREAFLRLGPNFGGATYQGSGIETEVLKRAGIKQADIVYATTGGDNRNLMIAQMARHLFGIQQAVARLHDPVRAAAFHEMGIETVCTTTIMGGILERYASTGAFPDLPAEMPLSGDAGELKS